MFPSAIWPDTRPMDRVRGGGKRDGRRRVGPRMDLTIALSHLSNRRTSTLVTLKRDGRPQLSNVMHHVGDDGAIRISVTADRAKTANARRDPRVSLYAERDDHWAYVVVEGTAELGPEAADPHDAAADELVELYRSMAGEHEDWEDYRASMVRDRRLVLTIRPERAYGMWS